jgi:CitMHS family citrate-Mg2+:H+ or citrate-Ca2+:H+ symporter
MVDGPARGTPPAALPLARWGRPANGRWINRTGTDPLHRPRLFWLNLVITLAVIGLMVSGKAEPAVVFMVAFAVVLAINYPRAAEQRARIEAHARPAMMMAGILFAAGAFTGIMNGAGLIHALAQSSVAMVPPGMGAQHSADGGADLHAAERRLRSRQLLFRGDAGHRAGCRHLACRRCRWHRRPAGHAHGWLSDQPADPATFLVAGPQPDRTGRASAFAFPGCSGATLVMTLAALVFGLIGL